MENWLRVGYGLKVRGARVPYNKESTHETTNKSPTSWSRLWLSWYTLSPFLRGSSWCPWVPAWWPRRLEVTPSTRRQRSCPLRKCLCNEHALWMVSTLQPIANSYINIINYLLRFRMVLFGVHWRVPICEKLAQTTHLTTKVLPKSTLQRLNDLPADSASASHLHSTSQAIHTHSETPWDDAGNAIQQHHPPPLGSATVGGWQFATSELSFGASRSWAKDLAGLPVLSPAICSDDKHIFFT